MVVRWRPVAKDGADLPAAARGERLARQIVSMGETYDFEYTPTSAGHCDSRSVPRIRRPDSERRVSLVRVPIRVE